MLEGQFPEFAANLAHDMQGQPMLWAVTYWQTTSVISCSICVDRIRPHQWQYKTAKALTILVHPGRKREQF